MNRKSIICQICGKEVAKQGSRQKFCKDCRSVTEAARRRESARRHNKMVHISISADTDEMMKLCLNCTRPKCTGECMELAAMAKNEEEQYEE